MAEQVEQLRSPVIGKGRRGHLQRGGARGLGEELDTLPTVTRRIQHVEGRWKGKGTPEGLLLFSHQSCLLLPPPSIFLSFFLQACIELLLHAMALFQCCSYSSK